MSTVPKTFHFRYSPVQIEASNGPTTVAFFVTESGLIFTPRGSNIGLLWKHLPAVSLAAARWHRKQQSKK